MKETKKCPKCEKQGRRGTNVIHVERVDDTTFGGFVGFALGHKGLFFSERKGRLEAYVCNDCGYVEFYVTDYPLSLSND